MMTLKRDSLLAQFTFIGLVAALSLSGCGQKGALYLADNEKGLVTSSERLKSTSQPQDAAFSDIGDESYERERYLEQQQIILPEPSDDPNDY